jgi:CrcB protein
MGYFWIGLAGMVGALMRLGLGQLFQGWAGEGFPWGTLAVNGIGCLVLGWFQIWANERLAWASPWHGAITTGLIGSFTTFSTFSAETMALIMQGAIMRAALYVLASIWGGILLAWAGWQWGYRSIRREGENR